MNSPKLSKADIDFYKEHGYLIVRNLLSDEECDEIIVRAEDVVLGKVNLADGNGIWYEPEAVEKGYVSPERPNPDYLFKIGHSMHQTDLVFRYYAMHDKIADALTDLIGPDIKCVQSMYIDKPANLGVGQPYHQDSYYLKTEPDTLTAVWIACDDVDIANGCLHVVPGSQKDEIHPHETPLDPKQRVHFLEVMSARGKAEVACELKKGDAVFFPGRLLHRSGNNHTSDRHRRAYVLHYADAKSKGIGGSPKNPHLLVRGRQYPGCL
ncbi:phytanoyl-CoA dioxygenase family protein [Paenibacillus thermotolerans]|uniref:phytanoyl-CoA dioxygenase family protein n=1 Tax=Paenibacillus thermotolerans TaxID=3027807 RepID=UPI002368D463|nr:MULTISPECIES: phytanoyl-CoA dioxygenase family protein [unclassified Paenibacillus]